MARPGLGERRQLPEGLCANRAAFRAAGTRRVKRASERGPLLIEARGQMTKAKAKRLLPVKPDNGQRVSISIEKVLQLRIISTKLVLASGATYQVGKPQVIKKRILRFRERRLSRNQSYRTSQLEP